MNINGIKTNEKSEFSRRCIGEAVLILLKNTEYEKLRISDIARKAGVSRTTFYQHYTTPYSVLRDYLNIILSEYIINNEQKGEGKYFDYDHIRYSFKFFDRYAEYFLTLSKNNLHSIMFEGINEFMLNHIFPEKSIAIYELYAYAGALLNTFMKWEEGGKKESLDDIAHALCEIVVR